MESRLLSSLDEPERLQVLSSARRRAFDRGEVICHEGDPADSLHLVVVGRLGVRITAPTGDKATINLLGPGDFFGELSLLRGADGHRTATITALEPAETLSISAVTFRRLCERHPAVEQVLVDALALRVRELSGRLLDALYTGLDRRVYRSLLDLYGLYAAGVNAGPVTIPLTQEQLADLVGGTRPSVNQVLQRLVAQGIVELGRGRVIVLDLTGLRRKAG